MDNFCACLINIYYLQFELVRNILIRKPKINKLRLKFCYERGYRVDIIDINRFFCCKNYKKKDLEIYFFLLKKVISIISEVNFVVLCKYREIFDIKKCLLLRQYYKMDLLIEITFLSKKIISGPCMRSKSISFVK